MTETKFTDDDISPGSQCPICGEKIVTWYATPSPDGEMCNIRTELIDFQGPGHGVEQDYIQIDHQGPSMG